ncbi:MAG TPA: DUF4421 domain-containing protein [Bacteroidales bacterium]|nr:DUF4421 domain-containing protein [Bacteroidales bacterium]
MKTIFTIIFAGSLILFSGTSLSGQTLLELLSEDHDSSYIESYQNQLTTRLYSSRKYTNFTLKDRSENASLDYRPNPQLNLGFGISYSAFTLNLGFNFPFINDDDDKYGNTDYMDLQTHILTPKLTIEFYFSITKGYHIANPDERLSDYQSSQGLPQRPDILTINIGAQGYYIFNSKKFSYRAAFNQDERQIKSAGSLLAGPALYSNYIQGDSSFIPLQINPPGFFDGYRLKSSRYTRVAAGGGYAHNFIYKKSFFLTLSMILGVGGGFMKINEEDITLGAKNNFDVSLIYTFRAAAGYNSRKFFAGVTYVNTAQNTPTPIKRAIYIFDAGNLRFNIAYRFQFKAGEEIKKKLM